MAYQANTDLDLDRLEREYEDYTKLQNLTGDRVVLALIQRVRKAEDLNQKFKTRTIAANTYIAQLEGIGRRLLIGYAVEEEEHGFPFNFDLRDAHRELRAALEDK